MDEFIWIVYQAVGHKVRKLLIPLGTNQPLNLINIQGFLNGIIAGIFSDTKRLHVKKQL